MVKTLTTLTNMSIIRCFSGMCKNSSSRQSVLCTSQGFSTSHDMSLLTHIMKSIKIYLCLTYPANLPMWLIGYQRQNSYIFFFFSFFLSNLIFFRIHSLHPLLTCKVKPLLAKYSSPKLYPTRQLDPICRSVHFPEACVHVYTPKNISK